MKLFWRIFLSFWLAAVLMIATALAVREATSPSPKRGKWFHPEALVSDLSSAVDAYEQHGPEGFLSELHRNKDNGRYQSVYLFDQQGKVLATSGSPPSLAQTTVAQHVLLSGNTELNTSVRQVLFGSRIQSTSGHTYVAVWALSEPRLHLSKLRTWLSLFAALLVVALICIALTLYLTKPIARLRQTSQRLAGGDLDARSMTPGTSMRKDELGLLAQDFDMMAARIQSLMTAQRRFVADVSHELGSPLTRMHLAVALLRRELGGKNSTALERIDREAVRLRDLVQQLLLVARMEAGSCLAETPQPVSMPLLCHSVVEDAEFEAQHNGCHVVSSCEDTTLQGYPQLLRRAISNVLRNAIRYAPTGTEVSLNCRVRADLQQITVEICDRGPGVPKQMLSSIFLPFFRTPGQDDNDSGTGLGLAIASEAVRLHGGRITAENRSGGGLTVTIILPFEAPPLQSAMNRTASEREAHA